MSKFEVETPQCWKDELYEKTSCKKEYKKLRLKPALLAATLMLALTVTTTAFAVASMPDFFKSIFQGNNEYLDSLYMPKNIMFDSNTDDIEVVCTGIMGDKNNVAVSLTVKSKGDAVFDINNHYAFESIDFRFENDSPTNADGYSATFGLNYSDDKTLVGDLYISGTDGNGFVGKVLKIDLKNLECVRPYDVAGYERLADCTFKSEITVDYPDTSEELSALKAEISCDDLVFCPVKADVSNVSLNAEFEIQKGNIKALEEEYPFDTITVTFKNGTVSKFNFKEKNEKQNIFYVNVVKKTEKSYVMSGVFGEAIDASEVLSVKFNDTELFAK